LPNAIVFQLPAKPFVRNIHVRMQINGERLKNQNRVAACHSEFQFPVTPVWEESEIKKAILTIRYGDTFAWDAKEKGYD